MSALAEEEVKAFALKLRGRGNGVGKRMSTVPRGLAKQGFI